MDEQTAREDYIVRGQYDGRVRHECDECGVGSLCDPDYDDIACIRWGCEGTMKPVPTDPPRREEGEDDSA